MKSPKQAAFSGQLSAISNCCTYLLQHFESKILTVLPLNATQEQLNGAEVLLIFDKSKQAHRKATTGAHQGINFVNLIKENMAPFAAIAHFFSRCGANPDSILFDLGRFGIVWAK